MEEIGREHLSRPAHEYSYRPPSPPHYQVPPGEHDVTIPLPAYNGIDLEEDDEAQAIKDIIQVDYTAMGGIHKWQYESRRQAQLILPFLYLGPSSAAKDVQFLAKEKITMLLAVRDQRSALGGMLSGRKTAQVLGISSDAVDISGTTDMIAAFRKAMKIINSHLLTISRKRPQTVNDQCMLLQQDWSWPCNGRVLVFCESGNERSSSIVAAYLMAMYGMDMVTAIHFISAQRFCVGINDTYKGLLLSYQDILEAQRDIRAAGNAALSTQKSSGTGEANQSSMSKRTIEDTRDVEMQEVMGENMDLLRFEGRAQHAPFTDME